MTTVHVPVSDRHSQQLLDIIQFKWLMVGAGHRVHVERMQSDPVYAQQCLALGAGARLVPLRACALALALQLGLALPH